MSYVMVPSVFSGLFVGGELNFVSAESRTIYNALFNIENLVLRARSEFNGFAGKDCELSWSTEATEVRI
jgi:hypothetical protein